MMIDITPPKNTIVSIVLQVFGSWRVEDGAWLDPCIVHTEELSWDDIVAGLTLIDEEASKKGIKARFSNLTLQEFVTTFRPKGSR